ncbi:type IV secretory system conjugative DNA transfer family protein [Sphingomonas canadensis]|uniref:Type IV secretory system conjugative DNA transfer family protein n=1 Tax=Sphingomonas canadensis TaxID=1219257 RepID=A0ABW3HD80_9SPHN|nr:type IV secretory system conjugative DNA transfer family protein [Sphingomonas canadensis]MCW3838231.1 type IV secretory system conjugative DNA transfer family protein [Sphingomonas canadensis]
MSAALVSKHKRRAAPLSLRLIAAIAALALLVVIAIGDAGPAGITLTSLFSFAAFFVALFYWIGGAVRALAQKPTTFGSAEWASLPYLEEHGITGSSGIRLGVFPAKDGKCPLTAEYFQALCGVTTVWNLSTAIATAFGTSSDPKGGISSNRSTTHTQNAAAAQRQLAYADELMRLHKTKQIIFIESLNPIIGTKVPWFEDAELKCLGHNLHRT